MFENWPNEGALITDPLINYILFTLLVLWPAYKIAGRLGVPKWTILPILIPYIGLIITVGLWAHMNWSHINDIKENDEVTS